MCRHAAILLVAAVAALAKGKYISVSNSRLISVPKDYLEFLNENELEKNHESHLSGEAVAVQIPPMTAPNGIPDIEGYLKVYEAAVKKFEQKPKALPETNNRAEQETSVKKDCNKPERMQFRRKEITTETEIVAEYPENRLQIVLHHSTYDPSADQENPNDDQENPGIDEETQDTVQEILGNDQENRGTDQDIPGSGKVNTDNKDNYKSPAKLPQVLSQLESSPTDFYPTDFYPTESCPTDFVSIKDGCYHFNSYDLKDWKKAQKKCKKLDSRSSLVTLESKEKWDSIRDYLIEHNLDEKNWWIGGSDRAVEGSWKWEATHQPIEFSDWCLDEPNNHDGIEDCGMIAGVTERFNRDRRLCWNDFPCKWEGDLALPVHFICEIKKD